MTTATHTATGLLILKSFEVLGIVTPPEIYPALFLSVVSANAPDFDIIITRRILGHRDSIYHYPFFWLLFTLPFFAYSLIFHNMTVFKFTSLAFTGLLSHFILDTSDFSRGIAWMGPFKKTKYSFKEIRMEKPKNNIEFLIQYFHKPHLIIDILACTFTLLVYILIR